MVDPMDIPTEGTIRPVSERKNLVAGLSRLSPFCTAFIADNEQAFITAPGSGYLHQHWIGGLADHYNELFAIAATLHEALNKLRPLPFTLEDALLVLFLHDLEKIYKRLPEGTPCIAKYKALAPDQKKLQAEIIKDYNLVLTAEQMNALTYIHGELDDYRKDKRIAGPLAAFVHDCDYWSARGWYDEPMKSGDLPLIISATV